MSIETLRSKYKQTLTVVKELQENRNDPEEKTKRQLLHRLRRSLNNVATIQSFSASPFIGPDKVIYQPELSEGLGGKERWQLEMSKSNEQGSDYAIIRLTLRGNLRELHGHYGEIIIEFNTNTGRAMISKTREGRRKDLTNEYSSRESLRVAITYLEKYGEIAAENNGVAEKSEETDK